MCEDKIKKKKKTQTKQPYLESCTSCANLTYVSFFSDVFSTIMDYVIGTLMKKSYFHV